MSVWYFDEVEKINKKYVFQIEKFHNHFLVTASTFRRFEGTDYKLMSTGSWRAEKLADLEGLECMRSRQGKKFLHSEFFCMQKKLNG